jgi:hypothetical protein
VPVSQTEAETRELMKKCKNNIIQTDLRDDIVWALVKLADNVKKQNEQVHCLWEGCFFG